MEKENTEETLKREEIEEVLKEVDSKKCSTLDEKLQIIKEKICIMKKNKEGYGYKYVDEASILLLLNQLLLKLNVRLIPSVIKDTLKFDTITYKNSKNVEVTETIVIADMEFTFKDIDNNQAEVISWVLAGQQSDASQALGSALTYANRYFLLKYFNVATSNDDPDKIRSDQKKKEEEDLKKGKLNTKQTKIKKLFNDCVTKFGGNRKTYEVLGTTATEFNKNFNDDSQLDSLIEQMELVLKGE